jgi:hypothetical protein
MYFLLKGKRIHQFLLVTSQLVKKTAVSKTLETKTKVSNSGENTAPQKPFLAPLGISSSCIPFVLIYLKDTFHDNFLPAGTYRSNKAKPRICQNLLSIMSLRMRGK